MDRRAKDVTNNYKTIREYVTDALDRWEEESPSHKEKWHPEDALGMFSGFLSAYLLGRSDEARSLFAAEKAAAEKTTYADTKMVSVTEVTKWLAENSCCGEEQHAEFLAKFGDSA